jgi:hypothetical protein
MEKSPEQLAMWAAYEAITAQRAIDAKANAEKKRRVERLSIEASNWGQAGLIRSYVTAVIAALPVDLTASELQKVQAWQAEALESARDADPIPGLINDLIGRSV